MLGGVKSAGKPASKLHASTVTRHDVPTVRPETEWGEALETMEKADTGLLPVTHDHTILGVVTKADFLGFVDGTRTLKDVMVTQLHAVSPQERVIHARRLMLDHGVERLPVLDGGQLTGILAETDLAFGFARFKDDYPSNHQRAQLKEFLVEDIMVRDVIAARAALPRDDRARLAAPRLRDPVRAVRLLLRTGAEQGGGPCRIRQRNIRATLSFRWRSLSS
jgi:CBS domain-containing protein